MRLHVFALNGQVQREERGNLFYSEEVVREHWRVALLHVRDSLVIA